MLAFLFDRKSGTFTGLAAAVLAVILFAGGVLVGLNLRWSREDAIAAALHPGNVASRLEARVKALGRAKPAPTAATSPASGP